MQTRTQATRKGALDAGKDTALHCKRRVRHTAPLRTRSRRRWARECGAQAASPWALHARRKAQRVSTRRGLRSDARCARARTDGHALGVDSAQVAVLEQLDHEIFHGLRGAPGDGRVSDGRVSARCCTHAPLGAPAAPPRSSGTGHPTGCSRFRAPARGGVRQRAWHCSSGGGPALWSSAVRARGPVPALRPRPRGPARGNAPGGRTAACGPAGRCSSGPCDSPSAHACLAGSGTAFAAWRRPGRPQQAQLRAESRRRERQRLARALQLAGCLQGKQARPIMARCAPRRRTPRARQRRAGPRARGGAPGFLRCVFLGVSCAVGRGQARS